MEDPRYWDVKAGGETEAGCVNAAGSVAAGLDAALARDGEALE